MPLLTLVERPSQKFGLLAGIFCAFLIASAVEAFADDATEPTADETPIVYETQIASILKAKCLACHNVKTKKASLDMSSLAGMRAGSETGAIIEPGKPDDSLLFQMLEGESMPPEGEGKPLTAKELELIRKWIAGGALTASGGNAAVAEQISQHDVVPIMLLRCTVCHGLREQKAGLDLRSKASMLKGGNSGPAIVLGKPEESLLLKRVHAGEMPPRKLLVQAGVRPMEPAEIETIAKWIKSGAMEIEIQPDVATTEPDPLVTNEDREFWSFRAPKRPAVPKTKNDTLVRTPIDAFVLRKLEEKGLTFSEEADRITLIRRVAFDLTGLPPKWEDVEAYLADESSDAYEKMVDHFLASRHYGERWGRYWLDVAGYADSEGKRSADPVRPHAWRYRDYVIRAFNNDKHYDRFLLEQLAGDELADYTNVDAITPELADNLIATGFLRMAPDGTGSDIVNTVVERMEVVADQIDIFSASILGLTMKCAQCHSHKYDPIPHRDYYRLMAVFKGAYDEHDWLKPTIVRGQAKQTKAGRVLPYVSEAERNEWLREKEKVEQQITDAKAKLAEKQEELIATESEMRLKKLPAELHADLRKMLATPAKSRNEIQKYLAAKFEKKLRISADDLKKSHAEFKKLATATDKQVKALQGKIPAEPAIRALWDRGVPSPTYIYRRGETTNFGDLVGPGVPSVLTDGQTPFKPLPRKRSDKSITTGRRLALAKWLVEPNHPLTSRVMINRIWYHHFGRGLVESLGNFGKTGTPPTHPELLDWLAREFIEKEWSMKEMHRLMMTSRTYRQSSQVTMELEMADPDNRWLSRMPLRRLEAESVRDSIIAVAGRLNHKPFGQPDDVKVRGDGLVTSIPTEEGYRRAVYVRQRRKEMPTILENFDLPQMIPNCIDRPNSTVASQALHLLNNGMIRELSDEFAQRIWNEAGNDPYLQVERVYQTALSRSPSDEEKQLSVDGLRELTKLWRNKPSGAATDDKAKKQDKPITPEQKALANYCHSIINSAAFLYVD